MSAKKKFVTPAKAGVQAVAQRKSLDSRLRGNDVLLEVAA
jgi:hypothetical protein